jgi:hypothetical protein
LKRFIQPLIPLQTETDVQNFLNLQEEPQENLPALGSSYSDLRFPARVIAFIYDVDDYDEEII